MEAAIWVTADGRKRLKRFSGGFSGQNRWVVGGENGVSGVRLELATQRSIKVHDILGTKWLRRLKRLEKLREALVGLCYQGSDSSSFLLRFWDLDYFHGWSPSSSLSWSTELSPSTLYSSPMDPSSPTTLFLIGRPTMSCPPTEARPAPPGISNREILEGMSVREDLGHTPSWRKDRQKSDYP